MLDPDGNRRNRFYASLTVKGEIRTFKLKNVFIHVIYVFLEFFELALAHSTLWLGFCHLGSC